MNFKLLLTFALIFSGTLGIVVAQEVDPGINPHSVNPIHAENQMYKMTVWRRMDLREKQNLPYFSASNEITKIIIDAVKNGLLQPYVDDSLNKKMSKETFFENLKLPDEEGDDFGATDEAFGSGGGGGGGWDDSGWGGSTETAEAEPTSSQFSHKELTLLNLKEDMIFDKIRSRLYYDIQSITIVIPASVMATGIEKEVGTFRYKDLEKLFRSMPEQAIWYNRYNTAQHRNMADAFLLRLFNARIYKVANPLNERISDTYLDPKAELIRAQQMEQELIEYEDNLWEY